MDLCVSDTREREKNGKGQKLNENNKVRSGRMNYELFDSQKASRVSEQEKRAYRDPKAQEQTKTQHHYTPFFTSMVLATGWVSDWTSKELIMTP
jgi:hypothetical protein